MEVYDRTQNVVFLYLVYVLRGFLFYVFIDLIIRLPKLDYTFTSRFLEDRYRVQAYAEQAKTKTKSDKGTRGAS